MKLIPILGFLLIALSVPVLTVFSVALIAGKTIPTSLKQLVQLVQEIDKKFNNPPNKIERQKNELAGQILKHREELNIYKNILAQSKKPDNQKVHEIEPLIAQKQKELTTDELQLKALEEQEKAAEKQAPVQEQAINLIRQMPLIKLERLLSAVSIFVFLAILALSRFLKSGFLRSSLLTGALATLLFVIDMDTMRTLILMLIILYTTRKIFEPLDCKINA